MTATRSRVVSSTRSRQTGTTVEVVDNRDKMFDEGDENWFTICVEHGMLCSHRTRALAFRFAPVPREWCPTCQEDDA